MPGNFPIMKIQISPTRTVKDIKQEFSLYFPNLKVEFFKTRHEDLKGSFKEDMYGDSVWLADINNRIRRTEIEIDPRSTVAQFEKMFQDVLGLPIQVFRRTGEVWIETIQTDHLTLTKQNELGLDPVSPMHFNPITLFL